MEVVGQVHHLGDEVNVTQSYTKRELVVKTDEQYPQFILIEFGQGKCNEYLDKLQHNDIVKIGINLRGREWVSPQGEKKYFNSIQGWRVESLQGANTVAQPHHSNHPTNTPPTTQQAPKDFNEEEHDDLPF